MSEALGAAVRVGNEAESPLDIYASRLETLESMLRNLRLDLQLYYQVIELDEKKNSALEAELAKFIVYDNGEPSRIPSRPAWTSEWPARDSSFSAKQQNVKDVSTKLTP